MIACPSCGAALREDSRFCDRCGTMLRLPEPRVQYQPYYYGPTPFHPVPIPADPQLIKDVFNTLALYFYQLDWATIRNVSTELSELILCGKGAWTAAQYLRKWVDAWKRPRPSETEP